MSIAKFFRVNWNVILLVLVLVFALYSTFLYLTVGQRGFDDVLVKLAGRFLQGHTALSIYNLPIRDISDYYNNYYVYFGPLASILLMPFVLIFKEAVPEVIIGVGSLIVSFLTVYLIAKHFKFTKVDSVWLAVFIAFSTVLFSSSVINITAYQVEVLGVPLVFLALWAYFTKKHPLLVGLFVGLAIMTRFTLMLGMSFFFLEVILRRLSFKNFLLMLLPVVAAVLLLGVYNNQRFHAFFETGYNWNISKNAFPISENFKYGDKNIIHVPANLYSFLIMAPEPLLTDKKGGFVLKFPFMKVSPWGVAIWFTSPLFLFLLTRFKVGKYTIPAVVAAFLLAGPVFLWYSIGYAQVGYRYALDFLPFLFLLLIPTLDGKLSKTAILLIVLGVLFNCIYTTSIWEIYPLFHIYPK